MPLGKLRFLHALFLENEEQPSEKTLEQCFSGKKKPTCQNSAIVQHFQKWPKNQGDVLARDLSIVSSLPIIFLVTFATKDQVSRKWKPAPCWQILGKECRVRVSNR